MIYVIVGIVSMVIGTIVGRISAKKKTLGTIFMDTSTGDPLLFLEIHAPIEAIMRRKTAEFDIQEFRENNR